MKLYAFLNKQRGVEGDNIKTLTLDNQLDIRRCLDGKRRVY